MKLLAELQSDHESLKGNEPLILMLRHAEKEVSAEKDPKGFSSLSKRGLSDSKEFGANVSAVFPEIGIIKSSPMERCMATARGILEGAGNCIDILPSRNLGDPGVFVTNDEIALNNFQTYGVEEVIRRQLMGQELTGMRGIGEGVKILMIELMEDLGCRKGLSLYVTHDAILCPVVGYLTRTQITQDNWFGFLEGAYFWIDGTGLNLQWSGQEYRVADRTGV